MRTDHGTANQAIEWVLHVNRDGQEREFLKAWQEGDAEAEWPEFYEWLCRYKPTKIHNYLDFWDWILWPFGRYVLRNPNYLFGVQIERYRE